MANGLQWGIDVGQLNNCLNALDSGGQPLGLVLDTSIGSTLHYKVYSGTLTTTTVFDIETALGRKAIGGFIANTGDTNSFTVSYSVDGTNYGDETTITAGGVDNLAQPWIAFKKVRLTYSADTTYQMRFV